MPGEITRLDRDAPRHKPTAMRLKTQEFIGFASKKAIAMAFAIPLSLLISTAAAEQALDAGAARREIRVGNVMPYSGPLSSFSSIGRAEAAYFDMINDQGGINGSRLRLISYDDSSDPRIALEHTRNLVERDKVLLIFGSFGTPSNLAVRPYVTGERVPQLFVASGDQTLNAPEAFPWTMGWQPLFRVEGRIYANYFSAYYPGRNIAVLWQNDQFGRDLLEGLQESLSDGAGTIVADITFDIFDESIDTQIDILRSSGADILVFNGAPAMAALALRRLAEIDWHPVFVLNNASASIANALRPAGLQNAVGVISTAFLKDAGDPKWKDGDDMKEWSSFMDKYYPDGDKADINAVFGYAAASTLVEVLRKCGDDLSRENVMRQAVSLSGFRIPLALPGIFANTSPTDFRPIKQMRLVQFDGQTWQPIGEVIDKAFQDR